MEFVSVRLRICMVAVLTYVMTLMPAFGTEVSFETPGVSDGLRRDLRLASGTRTTARRDDSTVSDIFAAARADYETLLEVMFDEGHLAAVISIQADGNEVANLSPLRPPNEINEITITIVPGPIFRFAEFQISPLPEGYELPGSVARGEVASTSSIQRSARGVVSAWRNLGYPQARVASQSITADHRGQTVAARFEIERGPQARMGRVVFTEESEIRRPERFRVIAGLEEGRVYSPENVERVGRNLRDSGVFASVNVEEAGQLRDGDRLDVIVDVREAPPRRIGAGVEIASDEGLSLSGFWLHRNLLGGAERFRFDAEISGIGSDESAGEDYRFAVSFLRPATFTREIDFALNWEISRVDDPEVFSNGTDLQATLSQQVDDEFSARIGAGLRYIHTEDEFGDRRFRHVYALAGARYDSRDDRLDARRGLYADIEISPFYAVSGAGENGIRSEMDLRAYRAIGQRFVFAGRAQFGTVGGASLEGVPADLLFFSGGGGTVRGHGFQTLGVDLDGELVGGRSRVVVSSELRADITDRIGAVAFVDWAQIDDNWVPDGGETHSGGGLGLRYGTPFGPLRLDIGVPISGEAEDNEFGVYIGFGQSF